MNTEITFAIHEVVWMMDLVADDILKEHLGISFTTGRMLMVVSSLQPCSQRQLADCLWVSAPAITKSLPTYVESGWIHVEVDPKQPRRNFLRLTAEGQKLADSCKTILEDEFRRMLEHSGVSIVEFGNQIQTIHSELRSIAANKKEMKR